MEKKILRLSLKKKWFDMIASGEKTEEYREIKQYWITRLCGKDESDLGFYAFDTVVFSLGYPKKDDTSKFMEFEIADITIGTGNVYWGAKEGEKYFIIKLGKRIN